MKAIHEYPNMEGIMEDKKTALLSDNISSFRGRRIHTENRSMADEGLTWRNIGCTVAMVMFTTLALALVISGWDWVILFLGGALRHGFF